MAAAQHTVPTADATSHPRERAAAPPSKRAPGKGVQPGSRPPRRKLNPRTLAIALGAWLIAIIFLLPYVEMVITALRPAGELRDSGYLPSDFAWSNFVDVWSESNLGTNLQVTLLVAAGSTVLVLLVALPAAYYTARVKYRGRILFLLLVLITQMFQPTSLLVGLYRQFYQLDMLNSMVTLIICNAAFNLAFAIWILTAYISAIPVQLEEAAMIDGMGRFGALLRVTLPLALPGVVTAVIFTFIAAWNEFVMGLTLSTMPDSQPLTVGINNFIGNYTVQWNYLFAASVIAIVPVVVLFAFIERHVVSGLTAGSVK